MSTDRPIVDQLVDREARAAEKRILLVRGIIFGVALLVFMPVRAWANGASGTYWYDLYLTVGGVIITLGFALWLKRNPSITTVGLFSTLFDYVFIGGLIIGQMSGGYYPAVKQSIENYSLLLPLALIINAGSGLRLHRRYSLLGGICCAILILMVLSIDSVVHGAPFYLPTMIFLVTLAVVSTISSFSMVSKTRALIQEASQMESETRRVKGVLTRYVSQPVADAVLKEDLPSGAGERQRVTVMFSDIRGFTRMSERLPPEEVVAFLNVYFSRMVGALFRHEGMLDKYMGDGMMAVFGAPIRHPDHALRAVKTALEMREELRQLNCDLESKGQPPLSIGIGIHTGDCVIGNIGTEQRLDYTAIGDTVNTASRIEGLTGSHGVDILISADTFAEVSSFIEAEQLPSVALRGKTANLDLYIVKGIRTYQPVPNDHLAPALPKAAITTKL